MTGCHKHMIELCLIISYNLNILTSAYPLNKVAKKDLRIGFAVFGSHFSHILIIYHSGSSKGTPRLGKYSFFP